MALEQFFRHKNEARRAEAALESAVRNEGFLNRMQFLAGGKAFHRNDFCFIDKSRQVEASRHRHTIHDCGTATAEALAATLPSAEKTEIAPQHFHESFVCSN